MHDIIRRFLKRIVATLWGHKHDDCSKVAIKEFTDAVSRELQAEQRRRRQMG